MPALPLAFLGIWAQALGGGALMCGSVCCLPWKGWQGLPGGCLPPAEPLLTSPRPAVYTQQIHPPTSLPGVKSYSPLSWPVLLCAGMCVPVHRHTHTRGVHTSPHHPLPLLQVLLTHSPTSTLSKAPMPTHPPYLQTARAPATSHRHSRRDPISSVPSQVLGRTHFGTRTWAHTHGHTCNLHPDTQLGGG